MKNIYLFTGNEELIINNKIEKLTQSVNADSYNVITYDMEEVNISKAVLDALTLPFISPYKVIILKNPNFLTSSKTDIKHNTKEFLTYLDNPSDSTILIINAIGLKLDEKSELVKRILKVAEVNDTRTLTPVESEGWLKRQMSIAGLTISDEAVKLFFSRVGKNLMVARNEVDKLINYVKGKEKITSKDVSDVVTKEVETEVFALTNAIIDQDKNKIISVYHDLTLSGKDAVQLMGLVSRNLIDIYYAKVLLDLNYTQNDIASAMGISSGRAYYVMKNTKAFSTVDLEENIIKLHDLDYKIKTGQIDSTSGLEYFLFAV